MHQFQLITDPCICHAKTQTNELLAGLAHFKAQDEQSAIVKESIEYFRVMQFFKNYDFQNPSDKVLIYLWVVAAHMFKTIENDEAVPIAQKKLAEIVREDYPLKFQDKKSFMGTLISDNGNSGVALQAYLKSLKSLLAQEVLNICYGQDGKSTFDKKFWVGVAKKKFLGMSYTGI